MSEPFTYPLIEGFWIRNFKAFRQIAVGSSFQQSVVMDFAGEVVPYELTPLTVFAGDSGTGKSTILDAFAFLADCINIGINDALAHRGGFETVYHFGGMGPLSIGIVYRPCGEPRSLTYILNIDCNKITHHPYIETEALIYRDHHPGTQPRPVLLFQNGDKQNRLLQPWPGASGSALDQVKRTDAAHLALTALAQFEDLPDIPYFKYYLDRFFVSLYTSSNAVGLSPTKFKFAHGGNLALDLKRVKEKHPTEFAGIMDVIAKRLPGVEKINFEVTESGRTLLSFGVAGHNTLIYPTQLGEGTLRLLSLLTLFEDPIPTPLLGIEEPAAFMGHSQIVAFTRIIQHHIRDLGGSQFFVTTNNNALLDQMDPTDVWFVGRDESMSIKVSRGLDELQFLGVDMNSIGPYWYSDFLYREQTSDEQTNSVMQKSVVMSPT
jgi:predicted ATPase